MNRSVIILISTLVLGYVFKTNANEEAFLISNESFLNLRDEEKYQHFVERAVSSSRLTESEIASFLDKHNALRGQTVPTASNMEYMVWDSDLATMAQQWSDGCKFAHGNPPNISPFSSIGQNLYIAGYGTESNPVQGSSAVQSWFNEDKFYTYANKTCQPKKMCGHYTQIVWARSKYVGCGMTFCPHTTGAVDWKNSWLVTCNYGPAGNYVGSKPFLQGTPCTKCDSGIGQCYNNQCRLCSTHSEKCECEQVCLNGGVLDSEKCSCKCADGFHGADCSKVCEDTHHYCGASPGWPKYWCNADHSYVLTNCPLMCGLCTKLPCLQLCSTGGTLDEEKCICNCFAGFEGEDCGTCVKDCKNGGVLNQTDCQCECGVGFAGVECESVCGNNSPYCANWPTYLCGNAAVSGQCPLKCGLCVPDSAIEMQLTDENMMDEFL